MKLQSTLRHFAIGSINKFRNHYIYRKILLILGFKSDHNLIQVSQLKNLLLQY